jgi:MFS transporter, YNFM family, putative membrane transport protein
MGEESASAVLTATQNSRLRMAAVMLAGYSAFLSLYAPQPILPLLAKLFNAGEVTVSLTLTVASIGVALAAPVAGILADRYGRKRIIVWSAYGLAIFTLASVTATTLPQLIFWRFLQGVCTPGVFSVTVAYVNDEWQEGGGAAVGSYVTGSVLGGFSGRIVSGFVAAHYPWQGVFVATGLMILVGAVLVHLWLPREVNFHPHHADHHWIDGLTAHLKNRRLMATCFVGFCVLFSLVGIFTYVTFRLAAAPYSLEPAQLGLIFCVYLMGAAATPIAGRCADRFGYRKTLAGGVALALAGVAMTLAPQVWMIVLGLGVFCAGIFTGQTCGNAYAGLAATKNRALAVGLYAGCYHTGGGVGAAVPGFFYNWAGWPACAAFIAVVQIVSVSIALKFWEEL